LALDGLAAVLQSVAHFVKLPSIPQDPSGVELGTYLEELRRRKRIKRLLFEGVEKFNSVKNGKFEPALQFLQGLSSLL